MQRAIEKIKSSSLLAIIALSLGLLWAGALLVMHVTDTIALFAQPGAWDGLAAVNFRPFRLMAAWLLVSAIAGVALSLFITIRAQGTPFLPQVARRMKVLALLAFLLSEAPNWAVYILRAVRLEERSFTFISNSGFLGLTFAAALYAFSTIIYYGGLLQQESDETL